MALLMILNALLFVVDVDPSLMSTAFFTGGELGYEFEFIAVLNCTTSQIYMADVLWWEMHTEVAAVCATSCQL